MPGKIGYESTMLGLNRLSIQSKMIVLLLSVSLASIGIIASIGYSSARDALVKSVENQLQGVRVAKTTTLKEMLEALRDQVISMSDSRVAIDGMRAFRQSYQELSSRSLTTQQEEQLKDFYLAKYLPELAKHVEGKPILEQYLPASPVERYLQYHYIATNPHPYQKMQEYAAAESDVSSYGQTHARLHPFFARAVKIFGFEDLMLIDAETLDIVYSYQKTTEFGTNLRDGPYARTNLGDRVRMLRAARDRDDFKIADFEPYRPSLGFPMGFAMSPIFDGPQMIGILALQFPIESFNRVLSGDYNWKAEGLGETGEVYVVGPDRTFRSRSRPMYTNPTSFIEELSTSGVPRNIVDSIKQQGTVMNLLPVTTRSVEEAFLGKSGLTRVVDYRGKPVLSAYGPLELDSLRWAVIAEVDVAEAEAPVREFGRKVVIVSSAMALLVSLLALISSYLLTKPLRLLSDGARRLGVGETGVKVEVTSRDEFGELARVFNEMSDNITSQNERLSEQARQNQELLLSILPVSAVERRREGDEKANREFADVSVLFAEIHGMEELGARISEAKALSILGDLIATFDDAAEKFGIEKVKTIGAAYLAVCGLSVSRPDHARRIVQFAEEMARIIAVFNRDHKADLRIAIGINSGPVVGGVVGRRKFLYDLWGDTVTIAKRLTSGDGAAIRVTEGVRSRLGDQFAFSGPTEVVLEGRPPIEAWQIAV
ncbi:MAG: adenylate/guanylate cyclase domain-containing protein [Pseudomonadota bacterium]|jgi:class 3 adenylate cyclase